MQGFKRDGSVPRTYGILWATCSRSSRFALEHSASDLAPTIRDSGYTVMTCRDSDGQDIQRRDWSTPSYLPYKGTTQLVCYQRQASRSTWTRAYSTTAHGRCGGILDVTMSDGRQARLPKSMPAASQSSGAAILCPLQLVSAHPSRYGIQWAYQSQQTSWEGGPTNSLVFWNLL